MEEDADSKEERKQQEQVLEKGAQVEVTSDEEGFKGAWYSAVVLDPPSKKRTRSRNWPLVQYKTLLADSGSTPLEEHVDPSFIRPLPPEEPPAASSAFEVNDVVDANYKDGWWTGVVRKVLQGSRFRVYFDDPPDVIEFQGKDLRLHWDWLDGQWVRPGKKEMSESVFGSGEAVEVNVDKGNVRDAWFPAVVVKENGDNTFLVRLQSSRASASAAAKRVVVDSSHIRPAPPCSAETSYELLEKVDAWCDSCWRAGVVTKVIAGDRFNVFFKQGNEDKEFKKSELRPHFVWVDGKWKSKDIKLSAHSREQLSDAVDRDRMVEVPVKYETSGATVDVELKAPRCISILTLMDQPASSTEKPLLDILSLSKKKIKLAAHSGNGLFSDSSKNSADKDSAEAPLYVKTLLSRKTPTVTSATKIHGGLASQNSVIKTYVSKRLGGDQPSPITEGSFPNTGRMYTETNARVDQPSTKVDRQLSGKRPVRKVVEAYSKKVDIVTSKGRATKSPFASSATGARVKESNITDSAAQPINELEMNTDVVEVPVILGLEAKGRSIDSEHHYGMTGKALLDLMRDERNSSNVSEGDKNLELEKQKGRQNSRKRKRGKPHRFVVQMPKAGKGGTCTRDDEGIILKDHTDEVESVTETELESAENDMSSNCTPTLFTTKSGLNYSLNSQDVLARKPVGETSENDEVGIPGALTYEADDDRPLSLWFNAQPCSTSVDASRFSSGPLSNEVDDTTARQVAAAVDCHAITVRQDQVEGEDQYLPFEKKSPIWKTIESMEVFQLMPQKPHFLPLVKCKEEYREGSAIGFMVTFASLFDKISSLRFDDPRSIFESILESLLDLEKHGFDIAIMQDRLNNLLSIKDKEGGLLNESLDRERLINEQASERKLLADRMEYIRKEMAKLEEEYAASESKVRDMDLEISKLQAEVDSAKVRIDHAQHNFEQLVTAPWKSP